MRLRNKLKICLAFWKYEPQYAYKRYAYKKKHVLLNCECKPPSNIVSSKLSSLTNTKFPPNISPPENELRTKFRAQPSDSF